MHGPVSLTICTALVCALFFLVGCNTTIATSTSEYTISQDVSSKNSIATPIEESSSSSHSSERISSSAQSSVPVATLPPENSQQSSPGIVPTPALQPEAENEIATNALTSQLLGDGKGSSGVALGISATTGYHEELNRADGLLFLSKIELDSFIAAEMKVEIPIPDAMIGIIEDNYISIGMPHTSTLYIYRDYEQAVVVGENKLYYDVPAGTYQAILELLL